MSLFIGVSILTETVTIWHLIGSAVVQGCIWAFLMPARQAVVPQLVGRENMTNAIALNASGMSLMTLAAPGIGGVLYAFAGPDIAYFTIAGLAFLAFVLTSKMPRLPAGTSNARNRMATDIADGLRYVANNRTVMFLLLLALSSTLFAMPFRSLLPAFVEQAFSRGAASVGLLMSMIGLGSLVGSLFIAGLRRGSKKGTDPYRHYGDVRRSDSTGRVHPVLRAGGGDYGAAGHRGLGATIPEFLPHPGKHGRGTSREGDGDVHDELRSHPAGCHPASRSGRKFGNHYRLCERRHVADYGCDSFRATYAAHMAVVAQARPIEYSARQPVGRLPLSSVVSAMAGTHHIRHPRPRSGT